MSEERKFLNENEVDKVLVKGNTIHTFINDGFGLMGCDMDRSKLLSLTKENKAELSGQQATDMDHGVVVWDGDQAIFCQTA